MNRNAKQLIILFLIAITTITLAACSEPKIDSNTTDQHSPVNIELSGDCLIIYESALYKNASYIRKAFYDLFGKTPEMTTDKSKASNCEILIGDTGRKESSDFINSLQDYTYGVKVLTSTDKITVLIGGKKSDYTYDAVNLFLNQYMPEKNSETFILKTTEDTILENTEDKNMDELIQAQPIQWEGNNISVGNGGYARMCELPDGNVACVYSAGGYIKYVTSSDGCKSWNTPTNVIKIDKTPNGQSISLANANIAVMNNGDLMVAFRAHTAGSGYTEFYSSIRFCISKDNGKTWSTDSIVAENIHTGSEFTGFWEPHMIYIKDGKLAMYYASDCIGGTAKDYPFVKSMTYQHIIMHIYDEQTGTFGAPIIASNGENHNSRDGMPVVCELSDGSYAMVIESSVMRGKYSFIIQLLLSQDGITWSDPITVFSPTVNNNYAGAPFIVCLDDGRIAISCQATQDSGTSNSNSAVHNSTMNVIVSNKPITYADKNTINQNDFNKVFFNPITPAVINNWYAIWPAMLVHNKKLICIAECGSNTSATVSKGSGIYIRIGAINPIN